MRVLCEAPRIRQACSPAVSVADGFPYPLGVEVGAKAKRPIDRVCTYRGDRKQYLPLPSPIPYAVRLCNVGKRPSGGPDGMVRKRHETPVNSGESRKWTILSNGGK